MLAIPGSELYLSDDGLLVVRLTSQTVPIAMVQLTAAVAKIVRDSLIDPWSADAPNTTGTWPNGYARG